MFIIEYLLLTSALLLALFAFCLSISFFFGAPFVATPWKIVDEFIRTSKLKKTDTVIDLGSGDGRILIESAKICKLAIGYEINPFLILWCKFMASKQNLSKKVNISWQNYKNANLKNGTVIFLYNLPFFIPFLEQKFKRELKRGTKIICYKFPLKKFRLIKKTKTGIYIYQI